MKNVETFGDLINTFLLVVFSYAKLSKDIHFALENYQAISTKHATRQRRQGGVGQLCLVTKDEQSLPNMKEFWDRQDNKVSIQDFFLAF